MCVCVCVCVHVTAQHKFIRVGQLHYSTQRTENISDNLLIIFITHLSCQTPTREAELKVRTNYVRLIIVYIQFR